VILSLRTESVPVFGRGTDISLAVIIILDSPCSPRSTPR
jgi:hypothetical protein